MATFLHNRSRGGGWDRKKRRGEFMKLFLYVVSELPTEGRTHGQFSTT